MIDLKVQFLFLQCFTDDYAMQVTKLTFFLKFPITGYLFFT